MMTQNPMRSMQPRTRRQMHLHRSILAVTLLASQTHHDVDALVGSNHSPLRSSSINFQPTNRRSSSLTFLSSIGDPERNSDRERKSKDASNNKRRRRRNSNNGKYNRQRRYTATDTTKQDSQNDRKEEKIRTSGNNSLKQFSSGPTNIIMQQPESKLSNTTVDSLKKRVVQLETLVSSQMSEIQKLRREMEDMSKTVQGVSNFVEQLQAFVHEDDELSGNIGSAKQKEMSVPDNTNQQPMFDDDYEIFGIAPTTIKDAADSAGQSILSAILAGKHRMLVDVRDAELTRDQTLLVEFIELAILPVAAGLQGLDTYSNRVKIIFPTVEDLLGYRKSMALAAPEVIALSTLGFDPIEEKDNLIVIVAPSPDDVAGCELMHKLLERTGSDSNRPIQRPVVLLNHHMMPVDTGNVGKFTVVYHLRLLSVQYMTGDITPEYVSETDDNDVDKSEKGEGDSALEAAMTHAREIGVHQGVTRAMVTRAYPKPWHVFVDVSPDTDADFEVAATFDQEPSQEEVNYSIVECLEGSEREDELVAKQMQAALEAGQLTRVSEMLGISPNSIAESIGVPGSDTENGTSSENKISDWDDFFYDDWLNEDSL